MKNLHPFIGSFILLIFILVGCSDNQTTNINRNTVTNNTESDKKIIQTITIKFPIQGGKQIEAEITTKDKNKQDTYAAIFTPYIERTDGNVYMIAIQMLNNIYGKERGLILLENAKIKKLSSGNFICWEIANPKQDFCIAPVEVSDTDKRIGAASFFVE